MAGGKRLRPILCLAASELLGGDRASAMPTASAARLAAAAAPDPELEPQGLRSSA